MKVDVVFGVWCTCIAATGSALVRTLKSFRLVKQISSGGWVQRNGVMYEFCQI
jgi:hypothetical protein